MRVFFWFYIEVMEEQLTNCSIFFIYYVKKFISVFCYENEVFDTYTVFAFDVDSRFDEKIIPGSATFLLIGLTSPYSWSSWPMKCPRRIFQYSPYPASPMRSLACASISQKRTPGLMMASAFSTAVRTRSWIAACLRLRSCSRRFLSYLSNNRSRCIPYRSECILRLSEFLSRLVSDVGQQR